MKNKHLKINKFIRVGFDYSFTEEGSYEISQFWNEYGGDGCMMLSQPVYRDGWILKVQLLPPKYARKMFKACQEIMDELKKDLDNE